MSNDELANAVVSKVCETLGIDPSPKMINTLVDVVEKILSRPTWVAADGAVAPIKCAECGDEILPICEACAGDMRRR